MDCSSPISSNKFSKNPISLDSCIGTARPHWTIYWSRATVLRHTDLPPALGPLITSIRLSVRRIESGTTVLPCRRKLSRRIGCLASRQSSIGRWWSVGTIASISVANNALARRKSTSARKSSLAKICGISGRICSVISNRIRMRSRRSSPSSSRIRLLASTTCWGSTKTVLPVADSSCTIPPILRL